VLFRSNLLTSRFESDKDTIRSHIKKAVSAIKKYAEKKEEERNSKNGTLDLLVDPEPFIIQFAITRIPVKKDFRFNVIEMPHAIIDKEKKSMCLLSRDPKEEAVAKIQENKLPIEKVIAVKSLKRKYTTPETRKELANRFDFFFCEKPIYEMMGKLLGSTFFEQRKAKIPFSLSELSSETFEKALRSSRFRVRGGSNVSMRIGDRFMETDKMVDNAMAVIEYMSTNYLPKNDNNVHNISIAATNVIELPIWSVPVDPTVKPVVETATTSEEQVTAAETPSNNKKRKSSEQVVVAEETKDISSVPVKMLKKVQSEKVESVKQQLKQTPKAKAGGRGRK